MKKPFLLILAVVLISSFMLGGCGDSGETATQTTEPTSTTAEPEMITLTLTKLDGTVVTREVEMPQYGGSITYAIASGADLYTPREEILHNYGGTKVGALTNEKLLTGNYYRGLAGTEEFTFSYGSFYPLEMQTGLLAESWEFPDNQTLVYNIQPGIYWTDGTELTAQDVADYYTWGYEDQVGKYGATVILEEDAWPTSITATGKYTVEFKSRSSNEMIYELDRFGRLWPPEFLYDMTPDTEWADNIGTGPFIVTDYRSNSWVTLERNPDYWREDPLIPENMLPYVETVEIQVVPEKSARLAALYTGQHDFWDPTDSGITPDNKDELLELNPDLQWRAIEGSNPYLIAMRTDVAPYDDVRVRKALSMAIDRESIVNDLYKGEATLYSWPVNPDPEFVNAFTPLEDLPEETREQFDYNPEGARALLIEALGEDYALQLQPEIMCQSDQADLLSLVIEDWADIGVTATLDVKEAGAYNALKQTRRYEHMFLTTLPNNKPTLTITMVAGPTNNSMIEDDWLMEKEAELAACGEDYDYIANVFKEEINPYILSNVWYIPLPTHNYYQFWQPWVKRYYGEMQIGNNERGNAPIYIWVDEELKAAMGY